MVQEIGGSCLMVRANVTDENQISVMAEKTISKFGRVDILINNAGVSQLSYTASRDLPQTEWDKIVAINLKGTFLCCKTFGRAMMDAGGGSIVNIATTAGITGVLRAPAYSASKAGVIALTKSLALEWASHHIRVNAVAPHYLETPLTEGLRASEKVYAGLIKQIPMKRFGKPSEVIGAVLYLASQASTYTTGSIIVVDGGYLAQ
jgi:NAD(P)-dependent dehydrogenase (short-subunit alcohol dehydrogenase family)